MSDVKPPFVIHVSEMRDYPGAVYIGRHNNRTGMKHSKWANPFGVTRHTREGAIHLYRNYIMKEPEVCAWLPELTGKPLACWCRKHDETEPACHGDVLIELWHAVVGKD